MNIQPILNIADLCVQNGVRHAIISPGSRSAPITLGFANHEGVSCKIINDERSAGFIALGLALNLQEPIVLVCTSGTAALNYAPAIAEAFYQQIPLVIITADRPPELIDQQDGQCLRQFEIFKNYIKASYQTPHDLDNLKNENEVYQILNNAIHTCTSSCKGPVHLNIPIREPFYPDSDISFTLDKYEKKHSCNINNSIDLSVLVKAINNSRKVLFIAGQQQYNERMIELVYQLIELKYPVVADINSNLANINGIIQSEELIFQNDLGDLHPELVITFGNSILSKKLKLYFRNSTIEHWHIAETEPVPDIFLQRKGNYQVSSTTFLSQSISKLNEGEGAYFHLWKTRDQFLRSQLATSLTELDFSEPFAINETLKLLPSKAHLHLSNSMTVRWLNLIGIPQDKQFVVQSNRGVSGIDGCTSTALGYSILSQEQNYLFTGDIAFFYDRNAFWNNYIPSNFKVVLLNNHEGGIFNMIPGPSINKDTLSYFTSDQRLNAKHLADEFHLGYYFVNSSAELHNVVEDFVNDKKCAILEIETKSDLNKSALGIIKNISKRES